MTWLLWFSRQNDSYNEYSVVLPDTSNAAHHTSATSAKPISDSDNEDLVVLPDDHTPPKQANDNDEEKLMALPDGSKDDLMSTEPANTSDNECVVVPNVSNCDTIPSSNAGVKRCLKPVKDVSCNDHLPQTLHLTSSDVCPQGHAIQNEDTIQKISHNSHKCRVFGSVVMFIGVTGTVVFLILFTPNGTTNITNSTESTSGHNVLNHSYGKINFFAKMHSFLSLQP